MKPDISVVIPVYNVEQYLASTLDSLRAQTFTNWEAILVDDGSSDSTPELALRYSQEDARIRLIQQQNRGVSAARNRALEEARGDALAFLDGDDLWAPQKLEHQLNCLRSEGVDVVYTAYSRCDSQGQAIPFQFAGPTGRLEAQPFFQWCYSNFFIMPSSVMLRTAVLREAGGFDPTLQACEDWELWLRLSTRGCSCYGMPEPYLNYRSRPGGLSGQGLFEPSARMLPRYSSHAWVNPKDRPKPYRVLFRNSFTYLGQLQQVGRGKEMFDLYFPHDSGNLASRAMKVLRHVLPEYPFWFVCRFALIPMAWQVERLLERLRG